ncbi:MAG: 2-carboxy-1,4-naphthoquinone phytyltransferase [Pseudanabaenaceae cyanobacterium]
MASSLDKSLGATSAERHNPNLSGPKAVAPRRKLWLAAIKPPMYSVAIMPIMTGTALAYWQTGLFQGDIFGLFLVGAILILLWENLCNDVFDADTGIDVNKNHSVVNLTGRKEAVFALANGALLLGIGCVLSIAWQQQDPTVLLLIAVCCGLGYVYQGPPFRWGYQGWGEILCFWAFGPLGVAAAYYSQTQSLTGAGAVTMVLPSVSVGIFTSLILFCSHFNQVTDDQAAGKRSPVIRLGTKRAADLLPWLCAVGYGTVLVGIALGRLPVGSLLVGLGVPMAWRMCQFIGQHHDQEQVLTNCRFMAVGLHFLSCLGLGLGFLL